MADVIEGALTSPGRDPVILQTFGGRLRNQFAINEAYRRPKELVWLEDLRAYKGLYDPDVKIETNNSKVYPKLTRSKVNIVLSRLHEMLFPDTDEKNWEISPTPDPRLAKEVVVQIALSLVKQDPKTGAVIIPTKEELNLAIERYAKERCGNMSRVIDDQFTEMLYPEETKKVLRSGLLYGTGVMKGPITGRRTKRIWYPTETGDYEEHVEKEEVPIFRFVRLWDWYPDASVTEIENMEGSFERHVMTKHDLRNLMKRDDFYADMIENYLMEKPWGNYVPKNWEVDLQVIEIEAGTGRTGSQTAISSTAVTGDTDDSQRSTNRQTGKKYEVLEYWGYVDGTDLEACGVTGVAGAPLDPKLEYAANVWLLGNNPIKIALYEKALDEYKVFYYEKDETSLWGEGLARVMRMSQIAIAAGSRMVLDNASCVAGPQEEINIDLMVEGSDINSFYPRKLWFRRGRGVDAQYPAIRPLMFDSHIEELLKIIDAFKQFGDEETCLPTWMIGQMVNNETAQATSGRLATITVSIKDVVRNFDTFTEGVIRDLYAWNMEFNPREDIKGDYLCKAKGVSSLVMKEIRMQSLTQLNASLTPEQRDYVPERDLLQEIFRAHDAKIPLRSEQEVKQIRQERREGLEMQLAIEMQKAEIAYKKAQTMAQLTKAKEKNVQAIKESQSPPEGGEDPRVIEGELAMQGTEIAGKQAKIRQGEEAHQQKMRHAEEDHGVKNATEMTRTAHDVAIKEKTASHGMKMKEISTKAAAQAKKTASKAQKGVKKPKKEGGKS